MLSVFRRSEVEKYLEDLQRELEQLKEKRAQDLQKVDAVARQRDMFRMLLTQATGVTFPQGNFFSLLIWANEKQHNVAYIASVIIKFFCEYLRECKMP